MNHTNLDFKQSINVNTENMHGFNSDSNSNEYENDKHHTAEENAYSDDENSLHSKQEALKRKNFSSNNQSKQKRVWNIRIIFCLF